MKRFFCFILVALAIFSAALPALAAPRYREKPTGSIVDYANVLSSDTVDQLAKFHDLLQDKIDVELTVVTVLFFDGKEPAAYTKELFDAWQLSGMDFLMVLAPGEDSYHTMAGAQLVSTFPEETQQHLLSTSFQAYFANQQYDQAIAQYMPALANLLSKQFGEKIPMTGLFGQTQSAATPSPMPSDSWKKWGENLSQKIEEKVSDSLIVREEERSGMSLGKIFLLFLICYFIFGGKKRARKRRGCGCLGCGPIGWIIAALGLGKLFTND